MAVSHLLIQATVSLGAAVVVVPLVKHFKLSAVLGYLIAGVLIGPYVLGWVGNSAEEQVAVQHFAEFGVVMMLFLIGLELRPALLWRLRTPIVGIGGLQVLLTTVVIAVVAVLLGLTVKEAIAVGMILSLSSTAIVLQTLNEKGQLKTPAGQNIFSVLLFQDIAVIPMLAVLPLLEMSSPILAATEAGQGVASDSLIAGYAAWLQVLIIFGSIGLIVLLGRFGFNPIFRLVAATQIREVFTALALFIVIAIALLMQALGLSPALGAFVAGVVLAESEYRHQLVLDIEPFKGLLLGLFFMTVGVGVDFLLLSQQPLQIIALVLLLVSVKFLLLLLIAGIFKMNLIKKALFAFSLAQAGEFAFVLFGMALQLRVLSQQTVALLTLVVALSMVLTPLLMMLLDTVVMPRLLTRTTKESDTIEDDSNPVIIAGYGRFGQMIGRLLRANGIESTVLDFNSDHVETVRRFGQKVYYGDATRLELLESAGIADAKALVITLADQEKSLNLIKAVQKHFPHVRIYVRAMSRTHAYELMAHSVNFERETYLSALELGQQVMCGLGYHPYRAHRAADLFKKYDRNLINQLFGVYKANRDEYIESSKKNELIIAEILKADMSGDAQNDYGWSVVVFDEDSEGEPKT